MIVLSRLLMNPCCVLLVLRLFCLVLLQLFKTSFMCQIYLVTFFLLARLHLLYLALSASPHLFALFRTRPWGRWLVVVRRFLGYTTLHMLLLPMNVIRWLPLVLPSHVIRLLHCHLGHPIFFCIWNTCFLLFLEIVIVFIVKFVSFPNILVIPTLVKYTNHHNNLH